MKILFFDLEWKPTKAYTWQAWKVNIYPEQIIEHGGLLCIGYKWQGDKKPTVLTEWDLGHQGMVEEFYKVWMEADAVVSYNGDKYDIPKITGEFLLAGLAPPPPVTSIDVLKTVKKFGFFMNRLGFIGPFVGVGKKVEHEGFALWTKVEHGDEGARRRMARYCAQDVRLLERLYVKVRGYIRNHPHLGSTGSSACGACGSDRVQSRGTRRTRSFIIQRLHCQHCGSWSDGKRQSVEAFRKGKANVN